MNKKYCYPADIMLPNFSEVDGTKWAIIACDQYTSEPEYWEKAKSIVGDSPSTLSIIDLAIFLTLLS